MADNINQGISAVSDLQEQLQERENKIDEALKRLKTQEKVLDYYLNKFNYMENLAKSAEEKYNQFLKNLKKDISEFAITHQVSAEEDPARQGHLHRRGRRRRLRTKLRQQRRVPEHHPVGHRTGWLQGR